MGHGPATIPMTIDKAALESAASRFVNPRARRMADIVASVPELHIRTFCTLAPVYELG